MATPASWENVTPNWGIRYPKPNAPAMYLPDAFQHMGTDLDDALTRGSLPGSPDTGWITASGFVNGFTARPTAPPQYRKIGSVVWLSGETYRSTAPTLETAFNLPTGFRPKTNVQGVTILGWDLAIQVTSSGDVQIAANTARTSATGYIMAPFCYLVD